MVKERMVHQSDVCCSLQVYLRYEVTSFSVVDIDEMIKVLLERLEAELILHGDD